MSNRPAACRDATKCMPRSPTISGIVESHQGNWGGQSGCRTVYEAKASTLCSNLMLLTHKNEGMLLVLHCYHHQLFIARECHIGSKRYRTSLNA